MTWIGWDDWQAPAGYIDVTTPWPAFEQDGQLVIFWVGRLLPSPNAPDRTWYVFSQRCAYNTANGQLTPAGVNIISALDIRLNWRIADVQRTPDGSFGVHVHHDESTCA